MGCKLSETQAWFPLTSIRIYGTPGDAILAMLSQSAGSGIPTTVLLEHLGIHAGCGARWKRSCTRRPARSTPRGGG